MNNKNKNTTDAMKIKEERLFHSMRILDNEKKNFFLRKKWVKVVQIKKM